MNVHSASPAPMIECRDREGGRSARQGETAGARREAASEKGREGEKQPARPGARARGRARARARVGVS